MSRTGENNAVSGGYRVSDALDHSIEGCIPLCTGCAKLE